MSGDPEHVKRAMLIDGRMQAQKAQWIEELRAQGVKAAHPDDGWVDREKNRIHLCYADFNDGLQVGDLLALGSPWGDTRIVRITGSSELRLATPDMPSPFYWHFEASGIYQQRKPQTDVPPVSSAGLALQRGSGRISGDGGN